MASGGQAEGVDLESSLVGMREAIAALQKDNSALKEKLDLILARLQE